MPAPHDKHNLPQKSCEQCGRPFAWRKKWRADWENVRYCSKRCRGDAKRARRPAGAAGSGDVATAVGG